MRTQACMWVHLVTEPTLLQLPGLSPCRQTCCACLTVICRVRTQRTGTVLGEAQLGPAGLPWDWHRVPAKGDVSCWTPREEQETLKPPAPAHASPEPPKQREEPADARRRQLLKSASVELDAWYDAGLRAPGTGVTLNPRPCSTAAPAGATASARPRAVRFSDGPAEPAPEEAANRSGTGNGAGSWSAGAEQSPQGEWAATACGAPRDCSGAGTSVAGQAAGRVASCPDATPQGAGRASTPQYDADQGGYDPVLRDAGRASTTGHPAEQGGYGVSPRGGPGAEPAQLDGWLAAAAVLADGHQAGLGLGLVLGSAPRLSHVSPFCATPPSGLSSAADSRQSSVSGRDPWGECRGGALHQPAGGPSASRAAEWGTPLDDVDTLGSW